MIEKSKTIVKSIEVYVYFSYMKYKVNALTSESEF